MPVTLQNSRTQPDLLSSLLGRTESPSIRPVGRRAFVIGVHSDPRNDRPVLAAPTTDEDRGQGDVSDGEQRALHLRPH